MSLLDDIRNALKKISTQDAMKGNFRSCAACSYFKNGFCTQVQPPAKILNVYEAQICIYYTPPTATKETQPISTVAVSTVQGGTLSEVSNIPKVGAMSIAFVRQNPIENPQFLDGFNGWLNLHPTHITIVNDVRFSKKVQFQETTWMLSQTLAISTNKFTRLGFWACWTMENVHINSALWFASAAPIITEHTLNPYDNWLFFMVNLPANDVLLRFGFYNVASSGTSYMAFPHLIEP